MQLATNESAMKCKFSGINDNVAAEGKYHLKCYLPLCRNNKDMWHVWGGKKNTDSRCFGFVSEDFERCFAAYCMPFFLSYYHVLAKCL